MKKSKRTIKLARPATILTDTGKLEICATFGSGFEMRPCESCPVLSGRRDAALYGRPEARRYGRGDEDVPAPTNLPLFDLELIVDGVEATGPLKGCDEIFAILMTLDQAFQGNIAISDSDRDVLEAGGWYRVGLQLTGNPMGGRFVIVAPCLDFDFWILGNDHRRGRVDDSH